MLKPFIILSQLNGHCKDEDHLFHLHPKRSPQPQINLLHPQKGDRYNPRYEGAFLLQLQTNDFPCITNRRSPDQQINLLQLKINPLRAVNEVNYGW
jgi:hypothetical protein